MELWKKWLCRGLLGVVFLFLIKKVAFCALMAMHASVQWLPRFTLAWVPGIGLLWFGMLVIGLGRLLSCEGCEQWMKGVCEAVRKCPWLRAWCSHRCKKVEKVAVLMPQGEGYVIGILLDTFEKENKKWVKVKHAVRGFSPHHVTYIIPESNVVSLDLFKSTTAVSDQKNEE